MKIYNQEKTQLLEKVDFKKGYLKDDTITLPEVKAIEEQGHWVTIAEYPNGGKDVEWVVDVNGVEYQPEREENIKVYIPYTVEELIENKKNELRYKREVDCFSIINRGQLWYDRLSDIQRVELDIWYSKWLSITDIVTENTDIEAIMPIKPTWLN